MIAVHFCLHRELVATVGLVVCYFLICLLYLGAFYSELLKKALSPVFLPLLIFHAP